MAADDWWASPARSLLILDELGEEFARVRVSHRAEIRLMDESEQIEDVAWVDRALRNLRVLLGRRALVAARGLHAARARDAGTPPG